MKIRNKAILTGFFSLTALLVASTFAEERSSVKSLRERYEQMGKEDKEQADQGKVRMEGKPNKTMGKPSRIFGGSESSEGPSSVKNLRERYEKIGKENKEQADQGKVRTGGKLNKTMGHSSSTLSEKEREEIAEHRRKIEEEALKPPASSADAVSEDVKSGEVTKAADHMMELHKELKRIPTSAELTKHLEKKMNVDEAQAKKITQALLME